jgi:vacuolar-type H+-ATPase subunit H
LTIGGEKMAIETVQAVRQAELNAAQMEKEDVNKQNFILSKAQEDAKLEISTITKKAIDKAEADLKQAEQRGTELMETAVQRAENEISLLKELVKSKEQQAIDLVLSEVI